MARLETYARLLERWTGPVNLVSRASLGDLWRRHMLDSAQLLPLLPPGARTVVDLGSGAGFPGLVLAILGVEDVHLIDRGARKCAFLREVARATGTAVTVHAAPIEALRPWPADIVTARACAPLVRLLGYAEPFIETRGVGLFLKGRTVGRELTTARKTWHMTVERFRSSTDPSGTILRMRDLSRERVQGRLP